MAAAWKSLLPSAVEQAELASVRLQREEGEGENSYATFKGEGAAGAWLQTWKS